MKYLRIIPVILISGVLLSGCSSRSNNNPSATGKDPSTATEKAPIPVKVMKLSRTKISRSIDYTSTILPFEEVNMAPSTPGRIEKIYVEVGDKINKGDDLVSDGPHTALPAESAAGKPR